jgi:hypothetical protein
MNPSIIRADASEKFVGRLIFVLVAWVIYRIYRSLSGNPVPADERPFKERTKQFIRDQAPFIRILLFLLIPVVIIAIIASIANSCN